MAATVCAAGSMLCLGAAAEPAVPPPQPPAALTGPPPTGMPPAPSAAAPDGAAGMPRSVPTRIDIPAIGTSVPIRRVALGPDGTLNPPSGAHIAGWSTASVTPGEPGAAVIVGHVDTPQGPAAFYGLGAVRPGTDIAVTRQDGTTAHFAVDTVAVYPKDHFPAATVYGPTPTPTLRLITCTDWSSAQSAYTANLVVFAHLTAGAAAPSGSPTATPTSATARARPTATPISSRPDAV